MTLLLLPILALRDLWHGWRSSLCLVLAVMVALIPVLLLAGLERGAVQEMIRELRSDPRILELRLQRDQQIPAQWFTETSADPRVGFLLPRSRYIAAAVRLRDKDQRQILDARLVPTGFGDPLLGAYPQPQGPAQIVLTEMLALRAGAEVGDKLNLIIDRRVDDRPEGKRHEVEVIAILPRDLVQGDDIFVDPMLETAIEAWREGAAVPELGWDGPRGPRAEAPAHFSSFRLYARDIREVPALRNDLMRQGFDLATRAEEIETAIRIEIALKWIFGAIGGFAVLGFVLTLGLHLAAAALEKSREFTLLRLLGLGPSTVAMMPLVQGAFIAGLGGALAALMASAAQPFVNAKLSGIAGTQGALMSLGLDHLITACLIPMIAGAFSGSFAGWRIGRKQISDGLRQG